MARRTNGKSGGVIHAPGANATFKRALSRSSYPRSKPRSKSVTSRSSTIRLGGGANSVGSTRIGS